MAKADRWADIRAKIAEFRAQGRIFDAEQWKQRLAREELEEKWRQERLDEAAERFAAKQAQIIKADAVEPASVMGRPEGTGLAGKDAPLIAIMRELRKSGKAQSNREAARMVMKDHEVEGFGTPEAKEIRLALRLGSKKKRKSRTRKSGK
jgi:hypothetical protein